MNLAAVIKSYDSCRDKKKRRSNMAANTKTNVKPFGMAEYKYENKRLKMENELLRDFLQSIERK